MTRSTVKELFAAGKVNSEVLLKGWVRTKRGNKQVAFIAVNDGTIIHSIQVVADTEKFSEELLRNVTTGCSVAVKGKLVESMNNG